jgi:hypothetical protein
MMDDPHTVTVKSSIIGADVSRLGFRLRYEAQKNLRVCNGAVPVSASKVPHAVARRREVGVSSISMAGRRAIVAAGLNRKAS